MSVYICLAKIDGSLIVENAATSTDLLRSQQFKDPRRRIQFVSARIILRAMVRQCYGMESDQEIIYPDYGSGDTKPRWQDQTFREKIFFNVTHSDDEVGVVISDHASVGIDLENQFFERNLLNREDRFAKKILTQNQWREYIQLVSERQKNQYLLKYFVLKEALSKATGQGLGLAMDQIEFSAESHLSKIFYKDRAQKIWSVQEIIKGNSQQGAAWAIQNEIEPLKVIALSPQDLGLPSFGTVTWCLESQVQKKAQVWILCPAHKKVLLFKVTPERGGGWHPVTGGVQSGELTHKGALRELYEETGFSASFLEPLHWMFDFVGRWGVAREEVFYLTLSDLAVPKIDPSEHTESGWYAWEDAKNILNSASQKEIFLEILKKIQLLS